jgi:hypothetical protein
MRMGSILSDEVSTGSDSDRVPARVRQFVDTRVLTESSARFYTEENLGRQVYTEPDIHCWA